MVNKACKTLDIDLIIRAHQVVQDGYEFFAGRRLITLFSCPQYAGQFDNSAATATVDSNLQIHFWIFKPINDGSSITNSKYTTTCYTDLNNNRATR